MENKEYKCNCEQYYSDTAIRERCVKMAVDLNTRDAFPTRADYVCEEASVLYEAIKNGFTPKADNK